MNRCGFDGVIFRLKRVHKQEILIFLMNFEGSRAPGGFWEDGTGSREMAVGRGRGRETLPLGACLEVLGFGGFGT